MEAAVSSPAPAATGATTSQVNTPVSSTAAPIGATTTTTTTPTPDAAISVSDSGSKVTGVQPTVTTAEPAIAPTMWTESLTPEMKNYVDTKGFKDPSAVLDSYVNLEKLRGVPQDRLLKLPESAEDAGWGEVYKQLGKPESPEGYGIKSTGEDTGFADWARQAFHDVNLNTEQAASLLDKFNEFTGSRNLDTSEAYKSEVAGQELALKKEWGSAYHQNIAIAQKTAQTFGIPAEAIDAIEGAIGFDGVMKMMNTIGSRLGEGQFVSGNPQHGFGETMVLTPEQAVAKISTLKKDPTFVGKYTSGDPEAKEKMSRLHQMAFPSD